MIKSKADIKRALKEGKRVYFALLRLTKNGYVVERKEKRVVRKAQTNAIVFDREKEEEPTWVYFNNEFFFEEDYFFIETVFNGEARYYLDKQKWEEL